MAPKKTTEAPIRGPPTAKETAPKGPAKPRAKAGGSNALAPKNPNSAVPQRPAANLMIPQRPAANFILPQSSTANYRQPPANDLPSPLIASPAGESRRSIIDNYGQYRLANGRAAVAAEVEARKRLTGKVSPSVHCSAVQEF